MRVRIRVQTDCEHGRCVAQPVLIRAAPGTGKTWSIQQLLYLLSKRAQDQPEDERLFVPMVIYVQKLAHLLRAQNDFPPVGVAWLKLYLDAEEKQGNLAPACNGDQEATCKANKRARHMLEQAIDLRTITLLVDGIDEAAELKEKVEDFVINHLVPLGIRVVATSRPEGVRLRLYQHQFVIINLGKVRDSETAACSTHAARLMLA